MLHVLGFIPRQDKNEFCGCALQGGTQYVCPKLPHDLTMPGLLTNWAGRRSWVFDGINIHRWRQIFWLRIFSRLMNDGTPCRTAESSYANLNWEQKDKFIWVGIYLMSTIRTYLEINFKLPAHVKGAPGINQLGHTNYKLSIGRVRWCRESCETYGWLAGNL